MGLLTPEVSHGSLVRDTVAAGVAVRRAPTGLLLTAAAVALGVGGLAQLWTGGVVVTCQRDAGAPASCRLDRRMLFDTIPIYREQVSGVRHARAHGVVRRRAAPRSGLSFFVTFLETADGRREAGRSIQAEPAFAFADALNERLASGAAGFEARMQPRLIDGIVQLFANLSIVLSVGLAVMPVLRWLWPASTRRR